MVEDSVRFAEEVIVEKLPVDFDELAVVKKVRGKTNYDWDSRKAFLEKKAYIEARYPGAFHEGDVQLIVEKFPKMSDGDNEILSDTLINYGRSAYPILYEYGINAYATEVWWGNVMLNEGIDDILQDKLLGSAGTSFSTGAARVGVGNSSTAASASQTGLQATGGGTVSTFAAMDSGFPATTAAQRVDFKGTFTSAVGNHLWIEFTVDNGSGANINLNRSVSDKGTKASGEQWTLEERITGA